MDAYIVGGYRTAVGKAPRGKLRFTRPDDLAVAVLQRLLKDFPQLDKNRIDDIIIGTAFPEGEQGFNVGRKVSIIGLKDTVKVPGVTMNRYCASGLETIATAAAKIDAGMADCIVAGGTETMSLIPFGGWRMTPNPKVAKEHPDWYWGMGLTAETVAKKYNISRNDQDEFALQSQLKALNAIEKGYFKDQIVPLDIEETYFEDGKQKTRTYTFDTDEGPRPSTLEGLQRLRPAFMQGGTVTAGNSSQTSDGAGLVMLMSPKMANELNIKPIARMVGYRVVGVEPGIMGIGPVEAVPKVLKCSGMKLNQIEQIELNEAFASQSLAVIRELGADPDIINVNGGAIALGHPLGATGGKLTVQLLNEMKRRKQKYGMVTMCIGAGQGAAGIFEML